MPVSKCWPLLARYAVSALILAGIALGGLFLWLVWRNTRWTEVAAALADISPPLLGGAAAVVLASMVLRAARWRALWPGGGVSTGRLFLVENAALGLNNISPIRLLDEPAILAMLTLRDRLPVGRVVATLLMSRMQDLTFTLAFGALALLVMPRILEVARPIGFTVVILMALLLAHVNLPFLVRRVTPLRRVPGLVAYSATMRRMWRQPRLLASSAALTVAYWLLLRPAAWLLARGMGLDISLPAATVVAIGTIMFSTTTPGLPGAVGTFEWATVALLGLWGVDKEAGIGYALAMRALTFVPQVAIAAFVLPGEGLASLGAIRRPLAAAEEAEGDGM
ncbi:MAG: flippase-like domain-containing protein [SAR202 cluster bacterium]|nr:flippase-like domain-containing protein [SAR202 cluster bacterium]